MHSGSLKEDTKRGEEEEGREGGKKVRREREAERKREREREGGSKHIDTSVM